MANQALPEKKREMLRFHGADLGYDGHIALHNVNLVVSPGDYIALVGSSGSGKTLLLRSLLGIVAPLGGRVVVASGVRVGYVPELESVADAFPLTALEIATMGCYRNLGVLRRPGEADRDLAQDTLNDLGIGHLCHQAYRDLSEMQRHRVLIARALTGSPHLLIVDESAKGLDLTAEKALLGLLDRIRTQRKMTILVATHSLNVVANHCKSIGILHDHQLHLGPTGEVLQGEYLRKVYGVSLRVFETEGLKVVI